MSPPAVVSLDVWRVPRRDVVAAMARVPPLRRAARRALGASFARVLGTADARFTLRGATPTRWLLLVAWRDAAAADGFAASSAARWWQTRAVERARLVLRPLHSRGRWDGATPFEARPPDHDDAAGDTWNGPVVGLTRASVRVRTAPAFYRAVPRVAGEVRGAPGLRLAFGIGEAPVLRQGTVSIWETGAHLDAFVAGPAHAAAVQDTQRVGWYGEELFARFALVGASGTIDGTVLAP